MKKIPLYLTADKITVLKAIIACLDQQNRIRKVAILVEKKLSELGVKRSGVFFIKVVALLVKHGIMIELDRSMLPGEPGYSVEYLFDVVSFRKFEILQVSSDTKHGRETGIPVKVEYPSVPMNKNKDICLGTGEALKIFSEGVSEVSRLYLRKEELLKELAEVELRISEIKEAYDSIGAFLTETEMGKAIIKLLSTI